MESTDAKSLAEQLKQEPPALPHQSGLYTRLAPMYDWLFAFLYAHIKTAVQRLSLQLDDRVLEIGVGTGLSLDAYPAHCEVVGIDIAPAMLAQAQKKIDANPSARTTVRQMSALDLDFTDDSFSHITAFHVLSVVPDSQRVMRELSRVCKPGGQLMIVNYFCGEAAASRWWGQLLDPLTKKLGWSSTLTASELFHWKPFRWRERYRTSAASLYEVVVAVNQK